MADEDLCVSCPICMERYSDIRYPIVAPNCGHSICIDCGNKRKSNVCVSCSAESFRSSVEEWPSNEWKKNFSLLDLVNVYGTKLKSVDEERIRQEKLAMEYKAKYESIQPNEVDTMECSKCHSMEKRERMKICGSCAEEWNEEWKGMKEEEIVHLILCGFCCLKDHSGHVFIDYLPWKLNHLLTSTVTDGQSTVSSMDEICSYEIEKGKEQLENWNEKMGSFGSLQCKTYRDGLSIAKTLKLESDLVTRYSEDCLPPLRKYRKVVTDSSSRLDLLKGEIEDGTMGVEGSKAAKEDSTSRLKSWIEELQKEPLSAAESETAKEILIESHDKPSEFDIVKADYEKRVRDLKCNLVEDSSISDPIHIHRLTTKKGKQWYVGVSCFDRLYFSVSHSMYLCAVDMYGWMKKPKQVSKGVLQILDNGTSLGTVNFDILKGSDEAPTHKLTFNESIKLFPNKKYLMQLTADGDTYIYGGEGGVDKIAFPGSREHSVTFYNHPESAKLDTFVTEGQFPGFYFRIGE